MVLGSSTLMTTPNFKQMTRKELKKYVLTHPTDDEAIRELFISRRNPNAKVYPYPYDLPYEDVKTIVQSELDQSG
jgi:hypothetical protein